ncbi:hypothetical protein [Actinoplanes siamensis]|uniref:LPXTG-motif cell wall-anchored protein n=1 Tax=Actinoplanes siamensis TaxID=1223317 RepID=A0A919NFG8_9ACTN|nr:hypothetical protein [Actinoplanes siamensis]GIF09734.1 hypothetical protein Asi03nite_72720 [Actinoplanes siamensis]
MPLRSARRLLAGLAAAGAASFGLVAPAYAAPPTPELRLADTFLGVNSAEILDPRLVTGAGGEVSYPGATLTLELSSDLTGFRLERASDPWWACGNPSGVKLTCAYQPASGLIVGADGNLRLGPWLKTDETAVAGATGTLRATFSAGGITPVTRTVNVAVAEDVDLRAGFIPDVRVRAGDSFDVRVPVTNESRSGRTVHGTVLAFLDPPFAVETPERFANCLYFDDKLKSCHFDTELPPGATFAAVVPLRLRQDVFAPGGEAAGFRWWTVDDFGKGGDGRGTAGTGPVLRLTPVAATRSIPQTDTTPGNTTVVSVRIQGTNPADLAAVGATVTGGAGDVVTARVGLHNNGPATLDRFPDTVAEATVTLPPGTVIADVTRVPNGCSSMGSGIPAKATRWHCLTGGFLPAGRTFSWELPLRVVEVVPNATGSIVLTKAYSNTDKSNDKAALVANPSGDEGGGLPITGPRTGPLAAGGASIVALGVLGLLLARRRRTRFEA